MISFGGRKQAGRTTSSSLPRSNAEELIAPLVAQMQRDVESAARRSAEVTQIIAVSRRWATANVPRSHSQFGGRPCIGGVMPWPRGVEKRPMHFLAQIDCTALPRTDTDLPSSGYLFFFMLMDDKAWGSQAPGRWHLVVHLPQLGEPLAPPTDISKNCCRSPIRHADIFTFDNGATLPQWPLRHDAVTTGPDDRQFAISVQAATGEPPRTCETPYMVRADGSGPRLLSCDPAFAFPHRGWQMQHIVEAVVQSIERKGGLTFAREERTLERYMQTAERWLRRAENNYIPQECSIEFRQWLNGYLTQRSSGNVASTIEAVIEETVRRAALDADVAAMTPPSFLETMRPSYSNVRQVGSNKATQNPKLVVRTNSMLGTPSDDQGYGYGGLVLFQIDSEACAELNVNDLGTMGFRIDPADLKAGRFERAERF